MSERVLVVTEVEQAAARARVKIDLAHGRTTPESVLRIANARHVVRSRPETQEPPDSV